MKNAYKIVMTFIIYNFFIINAELHEHRKHLNI